MARRDVPAARPGGLGATVAGSQPHWTAPLWWTVLAGASVAASVATAGTWAPRALAGVLAVAVAAALTVGLAAHTRRRLGGMSGDVLGATSELGTTAVLIVLAAATG